jgi:copper chaperone
VRTVAASTDRVPTAPIRRGIDRRRGLRVIWGQGLHGKPALEVSICVTLTERSSVLPFVPPVRKATGARERSTVPLVRCSGARPGAGNSGLTLTRWQGRHWKPEDFKDAAVQHRFEVKGMTCGHCVRAVTDAVRRVDPAARVDVDLQQGTVEVDSTAEPDRLAEAIRDEGYAVAA